MFPAASVIIPVRNAEAVLGEQLAALSRQVDAPQFEVVVVLNRCVDRSGLVADSYRSRVPLTVLTADEKAGAAYARNVGVARTSAPYLLFCDADDRVGDTWVGAMVRALGDTDADVVGGRLKVDRRGLPAWMYDAFYREVDSAELRYWGGVRYQITASLGIDRAAFEAVSGFDEALCNSHEEIDLTLRLVRHGYRVGVAPDATVQYRPRTTVRDLLRQRRGYADGGAQLLWKEGAPKAVPMRQAARQIIRSVGRRAVRERQWRPTALAVTALDDWFQVDALRRVHKEGSARVRGRPVSDFVMPPDAPLVGGLGFRCEPRDAYRYATEGAEPLLLHVLTSLLEEGDAFVDCGAGVGVYTVCAAKRVGPRGRVISFEHDPRERDLLRDNVARHGVADRVLVESEVPRTRAVADVADDSIAMVHVNVERASTALLDGASTLLDGSVDAVLVVDGSGSVPHNAAGAGGSVLVMSRRRAADLAAALDRVEHP
jgi:GT2 family glycosyltransferase